MSYLRKRDISVPELYKFKADAKISGRQEYLENLVSEFI